MFIQLTERFNNIFSQLSSCVRKGFGCVGAVLMGFSKAFDCLPHDLILAKLSVYDLSANVYDFLNSYLSNRKQRQSRAIL